MATARPKQARGARAPRRGRAPRGAAPASAPDKPGHPSPPRAGGDRLRRSRRVPRLRPLSRLGRRRARALAGRRRALAGRPPRLRAAAAALLRRLPARGSRRPPPAPRGDLGHRAHRRRLRRWPRPPTPSASSPASAPERALPRHVHERARRRRRRGAVGRPQRVIGRIGVDVLVVALFVAGVLLVDRLVAAPVGDHSRKGVAAAGAPRRAARSQAEALGARRATRRARAWWSSTRRRRSTPPTSCARPCLRRRRVRPGREHAHAAPHRRRRGGAGDLRRAARRCPTRRPEPVADGATTASSSRSPRPLAGEPRRRGRRGARLPRGREAPVDAARAVAAAAARRRASASRPTPSAGVSAAPRRDARPLRHHGAGHRHGLGAARDALRAAAGAGHQGEPRRRRSRTTSPTRWRPPTIRVQAPIPGKTAVGVEVPNLRGQLRLARRHPRALPAARLADGLLARQGRHRQGRARRSRAGWCTC